MSLVALPGGKLLGGTTTQPGTGGEKKANEAELYVMDLATHRVEWHQAVFPGAQDYTDLYRAPSGLIYGFADRTRFFVFDAETRKVVHEADTGAEFGPCVSHQGPRVPCPGGQHPLRALRERIARVEPRTHRLTLLAESPVPIPPAATS